MKAIKYTEQVLNLSYELNPDNLLISCDILEQGFLSGFKFEINHKLDEVIPKLEKLLKYQLKGELVLKSDLNGLMFYGRE